MRDYAELITRLKQSDDNCNAECCECSGECLSSGCNIFSEAADAIEGLLAAVPHWISVDERLPDDGVRVLVSCDDGVVRLNTAHDRFFDGILGKGLHGAPRLVRITHWMPLPAPPTEKVVE